MIPKYPLKKLSISVAILSAVMASAMMAGCGGGDSSSQTTASVNPWMDKTLTPEKRALLLVSSMTLEQKEQQLTGANPEILPDLPQCYGARHVTGIAALNIPTFRITNGPVGLGQNDCVDPSLAGGTNPYAAYTDPSSAKATALPSAIAAAASFDPTVAGSYGTLIGTEMGNLALHEFEAPGVNMARLPIIGRNFEYFGEDPFLTGTMAVNEIKSIQAKGMIGMAKHYINNEQETNRQTIQESIDRQVEREIYMIPFEMAVKDGGVASIMCAYNYVNGVSSCQNKETLTDVLRTDWGFSGYVQSDFFATKSTAATMTGGMDFMMPTAQQWTPALLNTALVSGAIKQSDIDTALTRRYTQMFKYGIFDRALKQTAIDFTAGGTTARDIGVKSAVLLQNDNKVLPFASSVSTVVVIGKSSQVYAQQAVAGGVMVGKAMGGGGGSSDVVPNYTVTPVAGIQAELKALGNTMATVKLILIDDANSTATIDGTAATYAQALSAAAGADAVVVMAGTIAEEGADRATFSATTGTALDAGVTAATGSTLDWYVAKPNTIATTISTGNLAKNSNTVQMIKDIIAATSTTAKTMLQKSALVLKDNAGVAMDSALVGSTGPAILETWFPGQEDGNIVAQLLFGKSLDGTTNVSPSGRLPVTFPIAGKGFLDSITANQFPGVVGADGNQTVTYSEGLQMGYRWYDARQKDATCATNTDGSNACVAYPFGYGLSYATTAIAPTNGVNNSVTANAVKTLYTVAATVTNSSSVAGSEVVQVYVSVPAPTTTGDVTGVALVQPPKRLVGFQKVSVAANGTAAVTINIDQTASNHPLSYWDQASKKWVIPSGTYTVYVGKSSSPKDLVVAGTITK
ncbi:MAG: glycoside hydrolase family 3 N-terminal domain-containing protein [Formivibrio sp.]|nr:glycoside hydrolase family 3 N-terminal domain-containing protein [Formivibrio sp.]